jgi:hypothetical protein
VGERLPRVKSSTGGSHLFERPARRRRCRRTTFGNVLNIDTDITKIPTGPSTSYTGSDCRHADSSRPRMCEALTRGYPRSEKGIRGSVPRIARQEHVVHQDEDLILHQPLIRQNPSAMRASTYPSQEEVGIAHILSTRACLTAASDDGVFLLFHST